MKLSELIKEAQKKLEEHGDIECQINVYDDYSSYSTSIEELRFVKEGNWEFISFTD